MATKYQMKGAAIHVPIKRRTVTEKRFRIFVTFPM
jgi:hypothetical protein